MRSLWVIIYVPGTVLGTVNIVVHELVWGPELRKSTDYWRRGH